MYLTILQGRLLKWLGDFLVETTYLLRPLLSVPSPKKSCVTSETCHLQKGQKKKKRSYLTIVFISKGWNRVSTPKIQITPVETRNRFGEWYPLNPPFRPKQPGTCPFSPVTPLFLVQRRIHLDCRNVIFSTNRNKYRIGKRKILRVLTTMKNIIRTDRPFLGVTRLRNLSFPFPLFGSLYDRRLLRRKILDVSFTWETHKRVRVYTSYILYPRKTYPLNLLS